MRGILLKTKKGMSQQRHRHHHHHDTGILRGRIINPVENINCTLFSRLLIYHSVTQVNYVIITVSGIRTSMI